MPGPAWVILPTYDEADNLAVVVAGIRRALPAARVLVVDDASPDGTGAVADALAARDAAVSVLHRPAKAGLGAAYGAGFARALAGGAGFVMEMDVDRSHDPADLPRLLAAAEAGADVVLGSRYVPGGRVEDWGPLRRALSRAGCAYARLVLGVPVRDLTGGFKCFRAVALRRIDAASARAHGYAFQVELTWRALQEGLRVVEVPITFRDREQGRSKMSTWIALEAAWRVPALRVGRRRWRPLAEPRPDADALGHES
jgi:dolichol-phosphate mannosyltransferase